VLSVPEQTMLAEEFEEPTIPASLLLVGWSLGSRLAFLTAKLLAVYGAPLGTVVVSCDPRTGFPSAASEALPRL